MKPKQFTFFILPVLIIGIFCGCQTPEQKPMPKAPAWWHNPRRDDNEFVFVKGNAINCETEQKARDKAYTNALGRLSKRLMANVSVNGSSVDINSNYALRDTRVFVEDTVPFKNKWYSWALVAYPQKEKKKLLERLDKSAKNIADIKQRVKNISKDIKLTVKTKDGKTNFRQGDKISFIVSSPIDCHVAVFCHQSNGESVLLFPNPWSANTKIYAKRPIEIPGAAKSDFEIVVGPPYGTDIVQVIACSEYSLLHKRLQHIAGQSRGYSGVSRGLFSRQINDSVSAFADADKPPAWGETSISVSTYEK